MYRFISLKKWIIIQKIEFCSHDFPGSKVKRVFEFWYYYCFLTNVVMMSEEM